MNFSQVEPYIDEYRDALVLDRIIGEQSRKRLRIFLSFVTFLFFLAVLVPFFAPNFSEGFFAEYDYVIRGLCFFVGSLWVAFMMLEGMYLSYYFYPGAMDMEVARILERDHADVIRGFLESRLGIETMTRLGITQNDVKYFLQARRVSLPEYAVEIDTELCDRDQIDLVCLALSFAHHDKEYAFFLFERGIGESVYEGALKFVVAQRRVRMEQERWLSRDHLASLPSIGRQWSYGQVYYLEQYAAEIEPSEYRPGEGALYHDDVLALEGTLMKGREPHALFISPDPLHGLEVVKLLARRIRRGKTPAYLEDKRVFLVNGVLMFETLQERFEEAFLHLMEEVLHAGNIILVFEHAAEFSKILDRTGTDLSAKIEPLLRSNSHVILLAESDGYHETLQTDSLLRNYTDHIVAAPQSDEAIIRRLQRDVLRIEQKTGLTFTYQSLNHLLQQIKRHISHESVNDATLDVLYEVLPLAHQAVDKIVRVHEMQIAVENHFGTPDVLQDDKEKTTLLHLEDILREYVVGQDAALTAVANTLRRVRAGLLRPDKPLGSFFFVGPTGVGKTETAKTLAKVYFGNSEYLHRLDMSEFNTAQGVWQLLGDNDNPGRLSSMIEEHPYGVLLLDEFEKAHPEVHNLFLQILDEGKATDGRGQTINAQNLIIIATSNAGTEVLINGDFVEGTYEDRERELLQYIIARRILPPELINRFDHSVLFEPLINDSVRFIAKAQLERLQESMRERGVEFVITPFAVSYLVHKGTSPEFGAREMQRVVADTLEAELAKAILADKIPQGSQVSFEASDVGEEFELIVRKKA